MKLSNETMDILKNFSSINQSILIREGQTLRTISPQKNIMTKAIVKEKMPKECAIYNLPQFINVIDMLETDTDTPDLEFEDNFVSVTNNGNRVEYQYAEPTLIVSAPDKDLEMPSEDINFKLSQSDIQSVLKASLVMSLPIISIRSDGKSLTMTAHDKTSSSNKYSIDLKHSDGVSVCNVDFKSENFRMIPNDYDVTISSSKISKFVNPNVTYWIAAESTSTFGTGE